MAQSVNPRLAFGLTERGEHQSVLDAQQVSRGIHLVDISSLEVSVCNEQNPQSALEGSTSGQAQIGLVSSGEFGSALGMILADIVEGNLSWSHWEQTSAGPGSSLQLFGAQACLAP